MRIFAAKNDIFKISLLKMIEGFARQQARIIVGSNMCVPTEFFANQYSKNPFKP